MRALGRALRGGPVAGTVCPMAKVSSGERFEIELGDGVPVNIIGGVKVFGPLPSEAAVDEVAATAAQAVEDAAAAQATAGEADIAARTVRLAVHLPDIIDPADVVYVPSPGEGALVGVALVATVEIVGGSLVVTPIIFNTPVPDGACTLSSGTGAGFRASAAPTDGNDVTEDGVVGLSIEGSTNAAAGTATVLLTFLLR